MQSLSINLVAMRILFITALTLSISGCFSDLFSSKNYAWFNNQHSYQSAQYWQALKQNKQTCGDHAFKEGIRIDGVTYYERESANEADREFRINRMHIYPRVVGSHEKQLRYLHNRYERCMNRSGWVLAQVEPKK